MGQETNCIVCHKPLSPDRKTLGYHKECRDRRPRDRFVIAGFGSKGNGAHVTKFTHGQR